MYMAEDIKEKWAPVMEHPDLPEITDTYKRDVTRRLLENQEKFLNEAAPANSVGAMNDTGGVAKWDPILISLVRRAMPQMIAYDVCGVQPMTGPTGLIFAMKSKYSTQGGAEALFDEADTRHSASGTGTHTRHLMLTMPTRLMMHHLHKYFRGLAQLVQLRHMVKQWVMELIH